MLENNDIFDYDLMRQKYKIIVDASHGGADTGIVVDGVSEKKLALDISRYMYDELKKLGIDVSITRESDVTLPDQSRIDNILNAYGNSSDVILISNHIDSDEDNLQIIYALRNDNKLANLIEENLKNIGLIVKEPYQRRLPNDTSLDYYSIHRNTGIIQPILIQYGNMSRYNDIEKNYKNYVDAVVNGLSTYLGLSNYDDNYYIVKGGDTLYSIAKKYNLTVDYIKKINDLSSNFLTIGQSLLIDNNVNDNNFDQYEKLYYVKKGDTLYNIANENNVSVDQIKKINNLSNNILSIGQVLKIPNNSIDNNYISYVVKKGDNLYSIGRNYNISVKDIMDYNNLSTNLLNIGQIVKIPVLNNNSSFYIVKSGDSLYSIARRYNTTVDNIKKKNNLTSSLLKIGQKLII